MTADPGQGPAATPPPVADVAATERPTPKARLEQAVKAPRLARGERSRVVIGNPADGGVIYWTAKLYGFAIFVILGAVATALLGYGRCLANQSPPPPDFAQYAKVAPGITRVYAADGTLLGEFAKEFREIVAYDHIPKRLVDAFLAVEDHQFFSHGGIYWKGTMRAAWANLTAGDFEQGGSTITQQLAKQFLGAQKSMTRKAQEAVMARRIESTYSKQAILAVYLNHIYLGAGAYGVGAAAHRYFQKDLDQLTLAECALIAGLAKAPSGYSPIYRQDKAIARRNLVLDRMKQHGRATAAEVEAAKVEPITLNVYRDVFPERMPYYAEQVRRDVVERYGNDALLTGGLTIETAAEPSWEAGAYANADYGARHQDKRQGWRGPEWTVDGDAKATVIARQRALYGAGPMQPGKRYLAIVDKVDGNGAQVIIGDRTVPLPLRNMKWAAPWKPGNADNDLTIGSATRALRVGDVVWVSREVRSYGRFREWYLPDNANPAWRPAHDESAWDLANEVAVLEQPPHPQTALFSADHKTGYVLTMVGGSDYDRSVFNRAVQACRQPGSTYKAIYYGLALDEGYGFDTILNDAPVTVTNPVTGEKWTPGNLGGTADGDVTMEYALVFSKNIPSVDIFMKLGADNVEKWARQLGFTTKIIADDALALGASCVRLDEVTRAFALYARGGAWWPRPKAEAARDQDWVTVRRVLDRDGNVVEDNTVPSDPRLGASDRFDRLAATTGSVARQAIAARTAFLTTKMLGQTIEHGFSKVIRATEIKTAGKTGTSSDTHDTWFIAFTSRHITTSWMGDDKKERALGKNDAAFMTAEPLWARYMQEVASGYPTQEIPWFVPPGVDPDDRGEHSKGRKGSRSDLIYRSAKSALRQLGLDEAGNPVPPGTEPP